MPVSGLTQRAPQFLAEGRFIQPRLEEARRCADQCFALVPGDARDRRVDFDDAVVGIGNQDALADMAEDLGIELQMALVFHLPGEIGKQHDGLGVPTRLVEDPGSDHLHVLAIQVEDVTGTVGHLANIA